MDILLALHECCLIPESEQLYYGKFRRKFWLSGVNKDKKKIKGKRVWTRFEHRHFLWERKGQGDVRDDYTSLTMVYAWGGVIVSNFTAKGAILDFLKIVSQRCCFVWQGYLGWELLVQTLLRLYEIGGKQERRKWQNKRNIFILAQSVLTACLPCPLAYRLVYRSDLGYTLILYISWGQQLTASVSSVLMHISWRLHLFFFLIYGPDILYMDQHNDSLLRGRLSEINPKFAIFYFLAVGRNIMGLTWWYGVLSFLAP